MILMLSAQNFLEIISSRTSLDKSEHRASIIFMMNSFDLQNKSKISAAKPVKRPRLSLNLHIMPQTVTSNWKKWLFLGIGILVVFIVISLVFYSFAP